MKEKRVPILFLSVTALVGIAVFFYQKQSGPASSPQVAIPAKSSQGVESVSKSPAEPTDATVSPQPALALVKKTSPVESTERPVLLDSEGNLPQGRPVESVPDTQVLDDPRDFGGAIIPVSTKGTYVPGLMVEAFIKAGTASGNLTPNQRGVFPTVVIVPNGSAQLTLSYPDLSEGDEVKLFCPEGGTIDGEATSTRALGPGGQVSFLWEGNDNLGRHSVHSIAGAQADEKIVSFWVGPRAYADASALPR